MPPTAKKSSSNENQSTLNLFLGENARAPKRRCFEKEAWQMPVAQTQSMPNNDDHVHRHFVRHGAIVYRHDSGVDVRVPCDPCHICGMGHL
eukprot:270092-Rhodomonas_salina.2